jgi:hypothetical protein
VNSWPFAVCLWNGKDLPPPHREHRLKLRITQAVYLQSVSIKAHTIHNRVSIVGIPSPHIGLRRQRATDGAAMAGRVVVVVG